MTLLNLEGFETHGGTGSPIATNPTYLSTGLCYTTVNGVPPRTGSYHAHQNRWTYICRPADEHVTMITGAAFWAAWGYTFDLFGFSSDTWATLHVWITRNADGSISAYRNKSFGGTLLGTSAAGVMPASAWTHVEAKVTLHDTTGAVVVRVNEAVVLSLTGIDTKNGGTKTTIDSVSIFPDQGSGNNVHCDDWYIANGAGTRNNDFLGDIIIETLYPSGNGNSSVLVGSDGNSVNNYALVNEVPTGSATADLTTYVGSVTSGDKDTYAFADLAHTAGTIIGVQTDAIAAKSDAGARNARVVTRSGGTDYGGSDIALSTSYVGYREIREVDPATSAAWSISDVNAAEFGFEARP